MPSGRASAPTAAATALAVQWPRAAKTPASATAASTSPSGYTIENTYPAGKTAAYTAVRTAVSCGSHPRASS
jgi:hypothetical protein